MARTNPGWPVGHQKVFNYFINLIRKESFLADVYKIRKTFSIPKKGLQVRPRDVSGAFKFPLVLKLSDGERTNFLNIMRWLGKKNHAGPIENMAFPLAHFVLYDFVILPDYYDLCAIEDIRRKNYSRNRYGESLYSNETHPISIRVSPHALKGDIVDYIERHYKKEIKPLQILHTRGRSGIGKKRSRKEKSIQLSDYIWKNIGLSSKKLASQISKDLKIILGYEEVGKLKSLERARRK